METHDFEIEPGYRSSDYHCNKGQALAIADNFEEAIEWFDRAIQINPLHAEAWRYKGMALKHLNRNDEALKCLQQARSLAPHDKDIRYQIANLRERLGLPRYERAEQHHGRYLLVACMLIAAIFLLLYWRWANLP